MIMAFEIWHSYVAENEYLNERSFKCKLELFGFALF